MEIFGLIDDSGDIDIELSDHTDNIINIASTDLIKELLVHGAWLTG